MRTQPSPAVPASGPWPERSPLPVWCALRGLGRCVLATAWLLATGRIRQPGGHVGTVLHFADGSQAPVYRETVVPQPSTADPAVLVVAFRLRWVRGWGHRVFRAESLLNTPLFVGFPGFVSKLWLAHDGNGRYRGFYQWEDPSLAESYLRTLWWVLALVSERRSIRYAIVPGRTRDEVLQRPEVLDRLSPVERGDWWRPTRVEPVVP